MKAEQNSSKSGYSTFMLVFFLCILTQPQIRDGQKGVGCFPARFTKASLIYYPIQNLTVPSGTYGRASPTGSATPEFKTWLSRAADCCYIVCSTAGRRQTSEHYAWRTANPAKHVKKYRRVSSCNRTTWSKIGRHKVTISQEETNETGKKTKYLALS